MLLGDFRPIQRLRTVRIPFLLPRAFGLLFHSVELYVGFLPTKYLRELLRLDFLAARARRAGHINGQKNSHAARKGHVAIVVFSPQIVLHLAARHHWF